MRRIELKPAILRSGARELLGGGEFLRLARPGLIGGAPKFFGRKLPAPQVFHLRAACVLSDHLNKTCLVLEFIEDSRS